MAARTNYRYRLDSTTFCTGVIYKLAFYFNNSTKFISSIIGVNGRNTKSIYDRALIDSRFYEIEYSLCKKADNRIFNCKANTPVVTSQLQSPPIISTVDNYCHSIIVSVTPPNIDTKIVIENNTDRKILPDIPFERTTLDMNHRSSSDIATKKLTILLQPVDEVTKISRVDSHHGSCDHQ